MRQPQDRVGVGPHRGGDVDEQHHPARRSSRGAGARPGPARPSGAASCAGCGACRSRRVATAYDGARAPARQPRLQRRGSSRRAAPSRRAAAAATSRWRSTSTSLAAACTTSGSTSPPVSPGLPQRQRRADLARLLPRRPCAAAARATPNHASKTWRVADQVVGAGAQRRPAGPVGRVRVVGADHRGRLQEAGGAVVGDRQPGRAQRAGEAEQDLVGLVRGPWPVVMLSRPASGRAPASRGRCPRGTSRPRPGCARPSPGRAPRRRAGAAPGPSRGSRPRRAA